LSLKEIEGLTLKELANIYEVNENALKVRLFRARQRVLKAYGQERPEDEESGAAHGD
jgi:RNA polymerase sigma-70 factor (ECF subfamily)